MLLTTVLCGDTIRLVFSTSRIAAAPWKFDTITAARRVGINLFLLRVNAVDYRLTHV
jgi:hypothetical protein